MSEKKIARGTKHEGNPKLTEGSRRIAILRKRICSTVRRGATEGIRGKRLADYRSELRQKFNLASNPEAAK